MRAQTRKKKTPTPRGMKSIGMFLLTCSTTNVDLKKVCATNVVGPKGVCVTIVVSL